MKIIFCFIPFVCFCSIVSMERDDVALLEAGSADDLRQAVVLHGVAAAQPAADGPLALLNQEYRCDACAQVINLGASFQEYHASGHAPVVVFSCREGGHAVHEDCAKNLGRQHHCKKCSFPKVPAEKKDEGVPCGVKWNEFRHRWLRCDAGCCVVGLGCCAFVTTWGLAVALVAYSLGG